MVEIIKTTNLSRKYLKGTIEIPALSGINITIQHGEFVSIVGKSGSGKSTLLNIIGGLDKPDNGNIFYDGKDLAHFKRSELAFYRCHEVGMIFQSFNLIHHLTAVGNISLALTFGGLPKKLRVDTSYNLLKSVGMEHRLNHKPKELSGGEMQRVAIARALANNPKILLADEPTGNLDTTTSKEIILLLQSLNKEKGVTIIMVTHDLETAQKISNRVIKLKDGQIIDGLNNEL
ncbi:MAG: hypothetical protein A2X13_14125 [Bacteroidetes bacterium GWC2_33_15]|nr:MAG: hypothetical protein A2X10_09340 [Bacteroidetes bacterium GWA2_33_15]OFX50478.1 MAG: hypothetical protein A2X13_14125 [Bacteroidetes bacterium GWC2_33_15]OFX66604.1 MAG: hypothetical protein A2X15_07750 [Bacteroidetes bacterium GWB2_32_14]OFX69222.1 MAG: hypothetical protein A2X14_08680 [Bacteroidetes bacterium GWD2_33_33]HAN18533.1 ABC transporter ATP-binding protein [Bacteroidales bacterium]